MSNTHRFRFDGEVFTYDLSSLTWGEVERIEAEASVPIGDVDFRFQKNMRLAFVEFIRRTRPTFSSADFLAAIEADPDCIVPVVDDAPEGAEGEPADDADVPSQPDSASPSEPAAKGKPRAKRTA